MVKEFGRGEGRVRRMTRGNCKLRDWKMTGESVGL